MPLVLADRVRETTTTTGTGTISLAGPVSGFQGFNTAIGNANTTYYTIVDAATGAWEVGLGTYTSSGSTLARTTVLSSSNSDALVPFGAGTKDVFVTQPAERAVYVLGAGTGLAAGAAAFTANGVPYADSTSTLATSSNLTFNGTTLTANALTTTSTVTINGGTANGVAYLNGSKVLTTGSALTFDGSKLLVGSNTAGYGTLNVARDTTTPYASLTVTDEANAANTVGLYLRQAGSSAAGISTAGAPLAFYLGGPGTSEQMRLTSTGLGIGTSSPSGKLHTVQSNGINYFESPGISSIALQFVTNGTNRYRIGIPSASTDLQFLAGGTTETMRLDSSGNLGIGTTSPTQKLTVSGSANLAGRGNTFAFMTPDWRIYNSSSGNALVWDNYTTEYMRLDSSGNLGIGTSSPFSNAAYNSLTVGGAKRGILTLNNASGTNVCQMFVDSADLTNLYSTTSIVLGSASGANLLIYNSSGNLGLGVTPSAANLPTIQSSYGIFTGNSQVNITANAYYNGGWKYYATGVQATRYSQLGASNHVWDIAPSGTAGNAITFTQAMTLDASSRLSLGTTSASGRLNVAAIDDTVSGGIRLWGFNDGTANGDRTIWISAISGGGNYNANINYSAWQHIFTTNSTESARINSSGNLGLGVTPSAWGASIRSIDIGFGTALTNANSTTDTWLSSNAYYTTQWLYKNTAPASYYRQASGAHQWYNAPSGNAGDPITFTQAMTLDASGNLLVGTTSPLTSASGRGNVTINGTDAVLAFGNSNSSAGYIYAVSTNLEISATSTRFINFLTNGSERARITSGGYFKASYNGSYVGSTASYHELVGGANDWTLYVRNTTGSSPSGVAVNYSAVAPNGTGNVFLFCSDSSATRAEIRSNGGLANYSANDVNLSDSREKTNFAPAKSYLNTICAIPVQTFNYIDQSEDDPGLTLGVVAQDVQAVAPELVMESNWGTEDNPKMRLSIYQTDLQYALMKALQELKAEFDAYKATHP